MWKEELWHGEQEEFMKVCEGLYSGMEMMVVLNGGESRWFAVEIGLRKGCHLSPHHTYLIST